MGDEGPAVALVRADSLLGWGHRLQCSGPRRSGGRGQPVIGMNRILLRTPPVSYPAVALNVGTRSILTNVHDNMVISKKIRNHQYVFAK